MQIKQLGDVAEYINGRAFKPTEWENDGLPIIRIQNLTNTSKDVNRTTKKFEDKYFIKNGDLLFAWSASLGAYIWNGGDAWLNQHIFKIIPNDNIDKMYLYYFLLQVIDELYSKTHGSGMVHITLKPFKSTPIPVPNIDVQKRIVERIETLFSKLDEAKEKLQNILDTFETRKAAILHKAFTGELTANWRKQHGLTLDSWEEKPFSTIVNNSKLGLVKSKIEQSYNKKYPYLKMNNITSFGAIDLSDLIYVDANNEEVQNFTLEFGDFLFNTRNSFELVGKNTVWNLNNNKIVLFNNNIMRVRFIEDINPFFISYYFNSSDGKNKLNNCKKNTTNVAAIYAKNLNTIILPVPTLDEQTEIVRIIDNLLDKEQQAQQARQEQAARGEKDAQAEGPDAAKDFQQSGYAEQDVLRDLLNDPFARRVFEDIYSELNRQEREKPHTEEHVHEAAGEEPPAAEAKETTTDKRRERIRKEEAQEVTVTWSDKKPGFSLRKGVAGAFKGWLRQQIDAELSARMPARLILDFGGVTFMDSSGVGLILGRARRMQATEGQLVVQQAPDSIKKMLDLARVEYQ